MRSLSALVSVALAHAELEQGQDIEALLATLEGEPVYDFYPVGRRFAGMDRTRRYYQHFIADVRHRITGYRLDSETIGEIGLIQEYTIAIRHDDDPAPTSHKVLSILTFGEAGLSGERLYSDERFFSTLIGPIWSETETISLDAGSSGK